MKNEKNGVLRHPQDPTAFLHLTTSQVLSAYAADALDPASAGPYRLASDEGVLCAFDDGDCMSPSCVAVGPRRMSREEFLETESAQLFEE